MSRHHTTVALVAIVLFAFAAPAKAGLFGYWDFDSTSSNSVANGANIQLSGDAAISGAQSAQGAGSLRVDGSDDFGFINEANGLGSLFSAVRHNFTIAMWARSDVPSSNVNNGDLAYLWDLGTSHGDGAGTFFNENHSVSASNRIGGYFDSHAPALSTDVAGAANQWYHVTMTGDGSTVRLYVDGVLKASKAQTITIDESRDFRLGAEAKSNNREWQGYLDEVHLYNQALSAAEINEVMNGTAKRNTAAAWDFRADAFTDTEAAGPGAVGQWLNGGRWRYMSTSVAAGSPLTSDSDFSDLDEFAGSDWRRSGSSHPSFRVNGGADTWTAHAADNEFPALAWEADFSGVIEYAFELERFRSATSAQYQLLQWDASTSTMNVLEDRTFLDLGFTLLDGSLLVEAGDMLYLVLDDNNDGNNNDRIGINATILRIATPEPSTFALAVVGALSLVTLRRRRR